jgi:hypothetical protein
VLGYDSLQGLYVHIRGWNMENIRQVTFIRLRIVWKPSEVPSVLCLRLPAYLRAWLAHWICWYSTCPTGAGIAQSVQRLDAGWTAEVSELESRHCEIFHFSTASRPTLGPTQPPIQCVPGVKRPGHEADQLTPTSAEVKNTLIYTSTPPIRLHGIVLN